MESKRYASICDQNVSEISIKCLFENSGAVLRILWRDLRNKLGSEGAIGTILLANSKRKIVGNYYQNSESRLNGIQALYGSISNQNVREISNKCLFEMCCS